MKKSTLRMFGLSVVAASALIACGGGSGQAEKCVPYLCDGAAQQAGSHTSTSSSTGSSSGSQTSPVKLPTMQLSVVTDTGAKGNILTGDRVSRAKVVVRDENGKPVSGVVVQFTGGSVGGDLLEFAPALATAITNENGEASIDVKARDAANKQGATAVVAKVVIASEEKYTNIKEVSVPVEVKAGATVSPGGQPVDPHTLVESINFVDVAPLDASIVIQGAGGLGRTESAQITFRVVNAAGEPVEGALVKLSLNEKGKSTGVKLHSTQVKTGLDGKAVATVTSGSVPTTVVIQAAVEKKTAAGALVRLATAQSGVITVTNSVATKAGFDLSSDTYNLNWDESGDKASITVRIADANGNGVPDGTPVVFTSDAGRVGSSTRGGCLTENSECTVDYVMQNPRPNPISGIATVTASTRLGNGSLISDSLRFTVTSVGNLALFNDNKKVSVTKASASKTPPPAIPVPCGENQVVDFTLKTVDIDLPAPAKTTVEATPRNKSIKIAVQGSPTPNNAKPGGSLVTFVVDAEKKFCEAPSEVLVDVNYLLKGAKNQYSNSEVIRLQFFN